MALKFGSTTIPSSYTPKFNSTAVKSIKYGSTEVWKKSETVTLTKSSADAGTAYALKWWTTAKSGYTSVTVTIVVSGTQDIFYGGIGTSAQAPASTTTVTPSGSLYNVRSVNGDNVGTFTKTLSLTAGTTYYVYAGVYAGSTSNKSSIKVTAVFS